MTNLTILKDDFTAVFLRFCAWVAKELEDLVKSIRRTLEQVERDVERIHRAAAAAIFGGTFADTASDSYLAAASPVRLSASTRG